MARRCVNAPVHPVMDAITVLPLDDPAAWDAYVAAHRDATPFHSSAWCRAVTKATGHRCHVLAAYDTKGAMAGLLPLHHIRSPLFEIGRAHV